MDETLWPDRSVNRQVFIGDGNTDGVSSQTWTKPRGVTFIHFYCLGGGGGGGAGTTGGTGTARAGGGGGGGASSSVVMLPAAFLPDTLWVMPGAPGRRGVPGTAALSGGQSRVTIFPPGNVNFQLIVHAEGGNNGGNGNVGTGGAAGTAGAVSTLGSFMPAQNFAPWASTGGQNGVLAGNVTAAAVTGGNVGSSSVAATGGAPGAGTGTSNTDAAGGNVNTPFSSPNAVLPSINPAIGGQSPGDAGGSGAAVAGLNYRPYYFFGGAGGASSSAGTGGQGGEANFGAGGGGGGGGITGGNGGQGGAGLIIITCI